MRLRVADKVGDARLEQRPPCFGGHQHRTLRADIVADPDHIDAELDQLLRRGKVIAVGNLQDTIGQIRVDQEVHQHLLIAAQGPRSLKDRGYGDADDPVLAAIFTHHALGIGVQFRAIGIRWRVAVDGAVVGQGMDHHLCVMAHAEGRGVRVGAPADAPFVDVTVAFLVVGVCPPDRSQQQVLVDSTLQDIRVAAAVWIVHLLAVQVTVLLTLQLLAQAIGKFRREADLHGTTIRAFMVKCHEHTVTMLHCIFPLAGVRCCQCTHIVTLAMRREQCHNAMHKGAPLEAILPSRR